MSKVEDVNVQRFQVERRTAGIARMSTGTRGPVREEPAVSAVIRDATTGRVAARVPLLNAATMCLPEGPIRGLDATDEQIIRAVMGDENIFTGARAVEDVA